MSAADQLTLLFPSQEAHKSCVPVGTKRHPKRVNPPRQRLGPLDQGTWGSIPCGTSSMCHDTSPNDENLSLHLSLQIS